MKLYSSNRAGHYFHQNIIPLSCVSRTSFTRTTTGLLNVPLCHYLSLPGNHAPGLIFQLQSHSLLTSGIHTLPSFICLLNAIDCSYSCSANINAVDSASWEIRFSPFSPYSTLPLHEKWKLHLSTPLFNANAPFFTAVYDR